MTEQLPAGHLEAYIQLRKELDQNAKLLIAITGLMASFKKCDADLINVDTIALGELSQYMNKHTCEILESLEDFLPLSDAQETLQQLKTTVSS